MFKNSAFRAISLLTGVNGVNAAVSFFTSVIAARTLPTRSFGELSVLVATCLFLALFLDFGLSQVLTVKVARRPGTRLYRDILSVRILSACAGSLVVAAGNLACHFAFPPLAPRLFVWSLVVVSALWQIVISNEQAFVQGLRDMRRVSLYIAGPNCLRLLLVLVGALLHAGFDYFLFAFSAPAVIIGLFLAFPKRGLLKRRLDTRLIRKILPVIALAGVTVCLSAALYRTGLWAVSFLTGSEAAGNYSVALQTASFLFIMGSSVSTYFFPEISRIDQRGDMFAFFVAYLRKAVPALLVLAPCVGVLAAATPLVFGAKYRGIEVTTFLLMLSYLLSVLNGPFYLFQQSRMRYGLLAKIHLSQIVVLVAGCALLVPRLGIQGAAIADLVMRVAALVFYVAYGLSETGRESLAKRASL